MTEVSAGEDLTRLPGYGKRLERPDAKRLTGEDVLRLPLLKGDSPQAHYPAAARKAAVDGSVVVDLYINEVGQVLEAQVISESPQGQGFGLAALDTAKTFEFANPFRRRLLIAYTIEFLP